MSLRLRVLAAFKHLHKSRLKVFRGDLRALVAGREKINEEFRKNLSIQDPSKIEELVKVAEDSSMILRKHVIQLEQVSENKFRANITEDTFKFDNKPFRDVSEEELLAASRKNKVKCRPTKEKN